MKRRCTLATLLMAAIGLAACTPQPSASGGAADSTPHAKTLQATEADSGKTIELATRDSLKVTLPVQGGTGYGWQLVKSGDTLFEYETKMAQPEEERPGGPQTQVFSINPKQSGEIPLEFRYVRAWEKDVAAAKTVTLKLKITD